MGLSRFWAKADDIMRFDSSRDNIDLQVTLWEVLHTVAVDDTNGGKICLNYLIRGINEKRSMMLNGKIDWKGKGRILF